MKHKWNFSAQWISGMSGGRRMKHTCGRKDGFIKVSGNPREEAEAWASLDLPTGK